MPGGHPARLDGDAVIATITTHHKMVSSAFESTAPIAVDLSALGKIDVSLVQLLCSAACTARTQQRPFALLNIPESVRTIFAAAGVDVGSLNTQSAAL